MARVLVLGSLAHSMVNFRGPLLREMVAQGHEVYACVPDASAEIREALAGMGVIYRDVKLARTGMNPVQDIGSLINMYKLFKDIKPDVYFGYFIKPVIYGSIAARMAGVPKIYCMIEGLGYAFSGADFKSRMIGMIAQNLYRFALRFSTKVFFLNPDDLDEFHQRRIIDKHQKGVLINGIGIDTESFVPVGYPKDLSFLLIARLIRPKGVQEYVDAARIIKEKYPDVKFRLVGGFDGGPTSHTEEELRGWVDAGIIEYLGLLSDVRPSIADCSVFVLPSYYREGLPRTLMEAMAMARPIITTDNPGCRQTVQQGENGLLVPVRNVPALMEAMEYFIKKPEEIERMGQISRQMAVDKFDVRQINAEILRATELS